MSELFFAGDLHGEFSQINRAAIDAGVDVRWNHGNHNSGVGCRSVADRNGWFIVAGPQMDQRSDIASAFYKKRYPS